MVECSLELFIFWVVKYGGVPELSVEVAASSTAVDGKEVEGGGVVNFSLEIAESMVLKDE